MSMTWRASLRYHHDADNALPAHELASVTNALPGYGIARAERDREALWVEMDIDADDVRAATGAALDAGEAALPGRSPVEVRILPEADVQLELTQPRRLDLVSYADIGALIGVSKQRAGQLAQREDFPAPVGHPGTGPVFTRESVLWWNSQRDRTSGRRPSATGPAPE